MGPRLFSRGKCGDYGDGRRRQCASMGPRLFSRGKCGLILVAWHLYDASMGPRLFSRGKVVMFAPETEEHVLQWGRGCSAAERRDRREPCNGV